VTKPNPENCKNCSSECAYDFAQLQYTIQHRTVLISLRFTTIIAQRPLYTLMEYMVLMAEDTAFYMQCCWHKTFFICCSSYLKQSTY